MWLECGGSRTVWPPELVAQWIAEDRAEEEALRKRDEEMAAIQRPHMQLVVNHR